MNCLITGANGFLGKAISKNISGSYSIWGLSRTGSDFNYSLEKVIPDFKVEFDLVIHAAAKAHNFSQTKLEKQQFHDVNVFATQNLLEGLTRSGIPKYFVFISSVSVYGMDFGSEINENTCLNAKDPYGKSKIHCERIVIEWCNSNKVIYTILRLPLLVGADPPGKLGTMIKGIKNGFYFNISKFNPKRSMVLVEDVARIIEKSAIIGGIYNLTDGEHPSFLELSNHISVLLGKGNPKIIPFWLAKIIAMFGDLFGNKVYLNTNKLMKIKSELTFDDSKARISFGWNPTPVLKGLKF